MYESDLERAESQNYSKSFVDIILCISISIGVILGYRDFQPVFVLFWTFTFDLLIIYLIPKNKVNTYIICIFIYEVKINFGSKI